VRGKALILSCSDDTVVESVKMAVLIDLVHVLTVAWPKVLEFVDGQTGCKNDCNGAVSTLRK
jgi:hypothetical protein